LGFRQSLESSKELIMQLSKDALGKLSANNGLELPATNLLELPEKVLQFGTGVLLRALPDYFIDKANKQGIFNGRVVVVKSTESDSSPFDRQNGLYTVCVRGIENGKTEEVNIVNASISRVLSASTEWEKVLECAQNPALCVVISNTTEVGIQLVDDNITSRPPISFPGKLLAFLYERYKAFGGKPKTGMVIIPTELITDNGSKLESIVLELAHRNKLDFGFIEWLETHNTFCNSLVDRIVPGKPGKQELAKLEEELGYKDELLTMSEVFRLWAIEGNEKVKEVLSFATVDEGVVIAPDITIFKELKLRLLNGTHSYNCGLAHLAGFHITREAITHPIFSVFTRELQKEIATSIPFEIEADKKLDFANRVFERFCNPFIDHQWLSITVQYTSKMKMRNIPLLQKHYELSKEAPAHMVMGFAGFLKFMRVVKKEGNAYYGEWNGKSYEIKDDSAQYFLDKWKDGEADDVIDAVLGDEGLWDIDLRTLPGFQQAVASSFHALDRSVLDTIAALENKAITV
jgi:tagaturonate reductase